MWGAGPRITDIPFLPFRRRKLPNRERDVTIAHETDIFLTVDLRRSASRGRYLREQTMDLGTRNELRCATDLATTSTVWTSTWRAQLTRSAASSSPTGARAGGRDRRLPGRGRREGPSDPRRRARGPGERAAPVRRGERCARARLGRRGSHHRTARFAHVTDPGHCAPGGRRGGHPAVPRSGNGRLRTI